MGPFCPTGSQPLDRQEAQAPALSRADRVEWPVRTGAGAGHTCLHLAEDEIARIGGDDVELAERAAEVPLDDLVAAAFEVLARQALT